MSELLRFFKDMRDNGYGLAEIAAQLGTSAIAEPVAGFAAMYDPQHGADAIREGMTYQPRTQEAQQYSQSIGNAAKTAIKPAMPIIDTWKKGVDIAGQYSPVVGAGLRTVPTAIGIAMGAKPALQAGRQVSEGLGAMQGRMIANANAPSTLNTAGFRGQRGVFAGINALTADKEALAKAQQMIAQGVDPAQVWKETGWGKGVDGKWRFEIDDSKATLRDYQFTPKEAYEQARTNAFISDNELMRNRAKSMSEYASMTKNQLIDEYKRTGNEIVDAAINGDIKKAKLLSEKRSGLDALLSQMGSREYGKTSSFIAHGDLGRAYPDVYKIHTRVSPDDVGNANAHYYRGNDLQSEQIVLGRKPILNSDKSTMLHELQHAIQQREGFARGGSPQTVNQSIFRENQAKYFDDLITQLEEKLPKPNQQWIDDIHDPIEAQIEKIKEQKYNLSNSNVGFDAYRSLAGEVEARTTQSRLDLDPQQRRENYPFDYKTYGYDVPAKSQTVDFGNNKANAQRPLTEFEQAHLTAQRNAALPFEKGGLGLPANNTAMDRARAMGFDVEAYHGSPLPDAAEAGNLKISYPEEAVFLADEPFNANAYARSARYPVKRKPQPNVIPVLTKSKNMDLYEFGGRQKDRGFEPYIDAAKRAEKDGVIFNDIIDEPAYGGNVRAILDPKNIRSRFAAFDPFNRDSSNLLAQSAKLAPTTALGAYMYNEKRKKSQGNQ